MARKLVRSMPSSIITRLLNDEEFLSFADISLLNYGNMGAFRHKDLLSALQKAKDGDGKAVLATKDGRQFALTRLPDGQGGALVALGGHEEVVQKVVEFGFLDPEREVRLTALVHAERQCWPALPSADKWRTIISSKPLSETELVGLLSDIRDTPSQFLSVLEHKWKTGAEIGVADIFPTSLTYFAALIGPQPSSNDVDQWVNGELAPDLQRAIRCSLSDGVKRAVALNIDRRLSPVMLLNDIPASELLPVMSGLLESASPIVLLSIVEIALARAKDDASFGNLAAAALDRLFGKVAEDKLGTPAWKLMPHLVGVALEKMSASGELWRLPPFWRRLAAFSHATVLIDLLQVDDADAEPLINWLSGLQTGSDVASSLLDMKDEPLWRAWDFSPRQLRALVIGRLLAMKTPLESLGLSQYLDNAIEALRTENGLFDADRPSPLVGSGARMSSLEKREGTDSQAESEYFSQAAAALNVDPIGDAWKGLSIMCRLLRFDESLEDCLAKAVQRISMGDDDESKRRFFEALLIAADIAATQPFEGLANAVASVLVREADKFAALVDVATGYRILLIASGAVSDKTKWMDWTANHMSAYAFGLPRGDACRLLLAELDVLQTLLPIPERCFGQARKLAAAGLKN